MSYLIITGSFACGMAFHNTTARYFYSLGREGFMPRALGKTHPKWKSPHIASVTQTVIAAFIIALFAIFTGTDDPTSQAYVQVYGLMALMGVIIILSVQALVSLAILVYYERYHRDEVHWFKTRLAPLLSFFSQAFVVYLLFTNIGFLGASSYSYAYWLGPIDLAVVLIGIGAAFYYKKRDPAKYEKAGADQRRPLRSPGSRPGAAWRGVIRAGGSRLRPGGCHRHGPSAPVARLALPARSARSRSCPRPRRTPR